MELTQSQKNVTLKACSDRADAMRDLVADEVRRATEQMRPVDMTTITGLTNEYNDLQGVMMQLTMSGASME